MGVKTLNLHLGNRADGLSVDPEPDWVLDDLISELNALELKLPEPSALELKLTAPTLAEPTPSMTQSREFNTGKGIYGCDTFVMHVLDGDLEDSENDDDNSTTDQHLITGGRFSCADLDFTRELNTGKGIYGCDTFVMHVLDGDLEDSENDDDNSTDQHLVTGRRFSCANLDFTSDSEGTDDELDLERTENCVMDKTGLVEGFLFELERERQLRVKEEIREKISALEADLRTENERSASVLTLVKEDEEARREADRKLDKQHQRKIAQARDTQLSAVQRDHEQKSQIEEWKIRKDAAIEEAKRKEKERQEIAKAEAEARLKEKVAEEAQKASLDAERKAAVEVAQREALQRAAAEAAEKEAAEQNRAMKETAGEAKEGIKIKVAENAKKLEAERLRKSMVYAEQNQSLRMGTNKDFRSYERQIDVRIRQIAWSQEIVREKSTELMKIIKDPHCPQSISILAFAMKVLAHIENKAGSLNNIAFALGHVIVLVTSQVPVAMDLILAEFHKACIYTVPKHIYYSKSAFKTELDYYKMIGYREEDGKIETTDSYLGRMKSYMMIYAALVQTEISGIINLHGLKEGWAWIARFLNELPATQSTAVALEAFLKIAGFALYRKYRVQFMKILNIISNEFLVSLKQQGDRPKGVIHSIETYLETKQYLEEPQGRNLPPYVESRSFHA